MAWIQRTKQILCIVLFSLLPSVYGSSETSVQMYIRDDVYADYQKFLAGRSALDITDFSGGYIRRDVVDMIIVQQALLLGGFKKTFIYQTGDVNFRNTSLLRQGKLLLSFDSYWLADARAEQSHVFISDAVIEYGQYYGGIYYAPDNVRVQKVKQLDDLAELTAVSTPRWRTDWQTLSLLPLKRLAVEHSWVAQAHMVSMQWVDFMLMPLMPSKGNEYKLADIHLVAHKNLVVLLLGSRHFVVSRHHVDGERAFKALQIGLHILRGKGAIRKAYKEAGFIPDLSQFKVLNATDMQLIESR
ncbi:hypothetical protein CWB96_16155 [Pseudoalteromonas citrea]|uniref:Uncharacterized protein n=1 Tax=Pseudoalteromonas citrea TaxID=43655 RepID=A0A5S3XN86_9GAMM|nr:hypothetical protein [Pseudoalteromonas citrea]TMP41565.1 hypothetical protein CWB97_14290 [Pseudoalteromonas citrea]TMP55987.1 hypothetical protein CWB96_16155 [Pseudoalteromonas citrea]